MPEVSLESNEIPYNVIVSRARALDGRLLAVSVGDNPADNTVCVRAATGSTLQQWEKREVPGGGFALINRERPDKCIARKDGRNGSPLVLVDVSEISKNKFCRWREEGNVRDYHPINSFSDWEQKINIPGNGPYRDGTPLITWEWSHGANNEMWMLLAAGYDLAAGADIDAVNTLAAGIYAGIYPKVFKGSIEIGTSEFVSVAYDMTRAPFFNLNPSGMLEDAYRSSLSDQNYDDKLATAVLEASKASFEGLFEEVIVTITLTGDTRLGPIPGIMRVSAQVEVHIDGSFTLRFTGGTIDIPGVDHKVLDAMNALFVPQLVDSLNENVLAPIRIPAIAFDRDSFTLPEVVTQQETLVAFSALHPYPLAIPPATTWPKGVAFVGTDALALGEMTNAALATLKIGSDWDWSYKVSPLNLLKLHGEYQLRPGGANFKLGVGSDNRLTGSISFSGGAKFEGTSAGRGVNFQANVTGSAIATVSVQVRGARVIVIFESVDNIKVSVDITGSIPWPVNTVFDQFLNAFAPAVAHTVAFFMRGSEFEVYSVPTIHFTIAGVGFQVALKDLQLSTILGAGSNVLLTVTGLTYVRTSEAGLTVTWSVPESKSILDEEELVGV